MPTITTKDGIEIYYKDWGKGQPIVFSHGWPLSADDWDNQMTFFLNHGYRVIAHDRRGHGRSSQTGDGHDMDHYADDLAALTAHLDLKEAICVPEGAALRHSLIAIITRGKWGAHRAPLLKFSGSHDERISGRGLFFLKRGELLQQQLRLRFTL